MNIPIWALFVISMVGATGVPLLIIALIQVWRRLDYIEQAFEQALRAFGIER